MFQYPTVHSIFGKKKVTILLESYIFCTKIDILHLYSRVSFKSFHLKVTDMPDDCFKNIEWKITVASYSNEFSHSNVMGLFCTHPLSNKLFLIAGKRQTLV